MSSSDYYSRDDVAVERGPLPLDIDNVHMLLQVEQEQIQKRTFTNWVNAQLAKRRPPCAIVDLFNDFRDGSKLLDLLEVMSNQRISRERGRGMFQHRSNIEKALTFLKKKSIKLVNINIPDIIDGRPSIILGLVWTIILQYHIEELASSLSFSSRQSSMESLASLDSRSTLSSRSASSSPVPPRGSPLHSRFRVSAKKALMLWVREQCHKAGCTINVKDFKGSWRSGVVFLAILYALRPDLVDLTKARTRSNRQNLEEAFRIAERELRIPRLLEPDDVDVRDPDEKSIMTYVAQFLQYSRDVPAPEEEMQTQFLTPPKTPSPVNLPVHYTPAISASPLRQATPDRKAQEVTRWLVQAYDELLEGWDSTEGESYSERYHVFQTFLVSFNEQRRPIMPLLTAMRRTSKLSEEQRALREAWDSLTEKIREYKVELDVSLPPPLEAVARWLLRAEGVLGEEQGDPQDHCHAADDAREKQELLKMCLEEMPQQLKTFQLFQNLDEYGNMLVPMDKMDEMKRRFTSVRVTAKYHGIKLEYREHRHTVLDLLGQIRSKLQVWKRPYISPEAVRVLLQEWHELVNTQELPSLLDAALHKLKQVSEKYASKSALASDYHQVSQQVKQLAEDTAAALGEVTAAKSTMGRVLSAWDSYSDCLSSMQAWLEQGSATHSFSRRSEVTPESVAEWGSRHAHLNEVGNFLMETTDPQTSRTLVDELRRLNMHWAEFVKRNTFDGVPEPSADFHAGPQDLQALIREATLLLKEPLETMAGPLRTYRKRIQFLMRKIKEVDLDALVSSPEFPVEQLQKLKLAIPEVMQTLCEAEQVCAELQHSVSGLDSRLAELLHWESEARELYHLLRASERQQAKGQDPRARALISRGLQLEGQVVTEEQDLQVMVMTSQKNSPIQYVHASAMQDRVRDTVTQSQEAVGMLSSLGARRDRSRSPPEGPPSKILIRGKEKPQHLRESESSLQPQTVSKTGHETFVPKIVIQEYQEEKMTSPPLSYSYAEAVRGLTSPPEGQLQASAAAEMQLQTEEIVLRQQQEQMLRHTKEQQPQQKVVELPPRPPNQQKQEPEVQHPQEEMQQYQVQQQVVTQMQVERQVRQTSEIAEPTPPQESVVKKPLSSQELKSRKAQAMKNRPWLQKPGAAEQKPNQDSAQEPTQFVQPQPDTENVASVQVIHQEAGTPKAEQPEAQGMAPKKLRKQKSQESKQSKLEQQQEKPQQTKQPQQQKPAKQKQEERKQKQPQLTPTVKQAKPDSDTKTISQIVDVAQPQTKAEHQSQGHTVVHSQSQAGVQHQSKGMSQTKTNTLQVTKATSEDQAMLSHDSVKPQTQLQPQALVQSQTSVPAVSQQSVQAHGQLQPVAHGQAVAQVRPVSPMQASLHGHIQPPVPSHVQLRSHPQSWAPVRPPSPKPPTQVPSPTHHQAQAPTQPQLIAEHETYSQTQTQTQSSAHTMARSSTRPQALTQSQSQPPLVTQMHAQSVSQVPTHVRPIPQPHSSVPPMGQSIMQTQPMAQTQVHAQSPAQSQTLAQPMGQLQGHPQMQYHSNVQPAAPHLGHISQGQMQAWTPVRLASPMPGQHPQAMAQHQMYSHGYPQAQSPAQLWTSKQEPQHQAIAQQRHPTPQPFAQQMCRAPQSLAYPAVQPPPQWPQAGPQQGPQMGSPGMGQAYRQPQAQTQPPWAQTPTPMRPQSPMQPPQMRGYNVVNIQKHGEVHQQIWEQPPPHPQAQPHPYAQSQPQQYSPHQPQTQRHPQPYIQAPIPQPPRQTTPQFPAQPQLRPQLQPRTPSHVQTQPLPQSTVQAQTPQPPQLARPVHQLIPRPEVLTVTQPKPETLPHTVPESLLPTQLKVQSPEQPNIQSSTQLKPESLAKPTAEPKAPTQLKVQSPTEPRTEIVPKPMPEQQLQPQPKVQSPSQLEAKSLPQPTQSEAQSPAQTQVSSPTQTKCQSLPQSKTQDQTQALPKPQPQSPPQPIPQQPRTVALSQVSGSPESQAESPDLFITPPVLAQAPPQAYTEAYAKAQALARNGFEEAKHCLQEHIMEAINVFKDKCLSAEQVSVKEETLRTLDPELLEEFLRAAKGMKAFCTPSQLSDMEFFTQSVTSQWEAVRAEISGFLPQLRFEVTRKYFNSAALQCEKLLSSQLKNQVQACFSADGSFAQAGQHLEALRALCDILSPEDAHRLAQTQLRECENRLAAIQRQFSGDQDAAPPKEPTGSSDQPLTAAEPSKTIAVEKQEVEKQSSVEEDDSRKEALEKYENCKRTLQAQLAKNEHSIKDIPSDSVSLKGLHTRLQEIQFLRQETESLWSDFMNQCSQLSLEQEKLELLEQWRSQQSSLQSRGSSLAAALRQIDSTENHMVDFTDRLDRYLRQPKDITAFTLANSNILKDIKELDDNIQNELDQLSRLDPESSSLDPRDCFPLTREVETHRTSLDQLRQQVRKSEAAARALDRFLMSLRTVDEDMSGVQGAPCSDATVLQDCRSKLTLIRQSIDSLKEKAPQLDLLLQGARLTVTRDGAPASCLDMVGILLKKLEDADSGLLGQQQNLKKETQSKSMGLRKRTLLGELRKLLETIESRGLKELTMPAVQQRLRALSDLEEQLQAQNSELQSLRQLQEKQGEENVLQELETQYEETQRSLTDGKQQCSVLMELLKRFKSCRSQLSSTMQRAEQTIGDQASYMGKDNLQKSITKVGDMKEELSGLGERMEDIRGVCKQLQSQLRNFPDCSDASFECEADALMDNWLDVTEKTDAYMDNLQVALELWEKQLMLGSEVDSWAVTKLALFAESHPFHTEPQVLAMRDEINANEENIEHFHKKSEEIQGMLQSQEAPLELQVMETQLKKRMEQVKELFTDCTDVFEELMAVKKHLAEKIEECQLAVENIQSSISKIEASEEKVETQIQDLSDDLQDQEEQAEAVMKEMGLVSSVASPQVLEVLAVDCSRLRDAITRTKDMIHLKREERDKGLLKVINDEKQSFENWFQDLQLSVNECFENPESRSNVEISLQRLTVFLKSPDAERRLDQLRAHLERGGAQLGAQQLSDLADWLAEQQEEVSTFKAHCHNRQRQMEALHGDLESLQKQHDGFREWLQSKEKQSTEPNKVKDLLKDLQNESQRAENLGELLASVRRQGVRGDGLLKDGDNLIQRYRKLQARLQEQVENQRALEEEVGCFQTQAECTTGWIKELLQPLTSAGRAELRQRAETVLSSRQEGDSKLDELRSKNQHLLDQDELDQNRRLVAEQSFRDVEAQWREALRAAEAAFVRAETQERLDKEVEDFRTQSESVQAWIRELDQNLQAGGDALAEEKLQVVQAALQLKPDGESKLQNLRGRGQTLCDSPDLDEGLRREVEDAVRHTEEQWSAAMKAAQDALSSAEVETTTEAELNAFRNEKDKTQTWIKEQKQKLLSLGSQMTFEERLQVAQAAMASKPEGEVKVHNLQQRSQQLCEKLDDSRRAEVTQQVREAEQHLEALLQASKQAELRSLSDDFEDQSTSAQTWIREKHQQLQAVGSQTPPQERHHSAETILSSKPDGDCKVNNLRRRGQTLCNRQDVDEARKSHIQQSVKDTEEQWRTVLQSAKQVSAGAEAQISQETKRRESELSDFESHQQHLNHWLTELQQRLEMLADEPRAEERLHTAQDALSSKAEGDSKIQNLKSQVQSLCEQNLEETKKEELQQMVRDAEDRWNRTLQGARTALEEAERRCALEAQLRDNEASRENTRGWLEGKQRLLDALDCRKDPEETISMAQTVLSCRPEGDAQLTELRRQSQSLCERDDVDQPTRRRSQEALEELEQRWRALLEGADGTLREAEVQYSLSRELEAFHSQAVSTASCVDELQRQFESKGSGAQGSQVQIEERLNAAQVILSSKSSSETQLTELRRRAQSLCDREELQEDRKLEVQSRVRDVDGQWRALLQAAGNAHRELSSLVELLASCRCQRGQAEARLAELRKQTSDLPRLFPWPGLGERRQAVEQARTLLDHSTALAPVLSSLRKQSAELLDATQDHSWSDASLKEMEESIPTLLKELTEAVSDLEQGILAERQCTQLVEQHEAAQDWLREQVKNQAAPPAEREGLHSTVNTMKALLQTVDREQREMKELDAARDGLLGLCTPGGRDALTLEISHLHDLCATSERDVRERLVGCEAQLEELDKQANKRAAVLKERGAALQWELRSLDQALSYSEPQDNVAQLQQHWQSLQTCEKSLQGLGEKVHELHQEVKSVPANELPGEIISMVDSLCQQHDSLKSRLDEHRCNCSTNAARSLTDTLQALQRWSHSSPAESAASLQAASDEGEKLQTVLREALSHRQFLSNSLTSDLFDKVMGVGSEALGQAENQMASLGKKLKELEERSKQKVVQTPIVAPPRRNKESPKKKPNVPVPEKSAVVEEESSLSVEAESLKLDVTTEQGSTEHIEEYLFVQRVIEESVAFVKEELAQTKVEQEMVSRTTHKSTTLAGCISKDETKPTENVTQDTPELPTVGEEIGEENLNSATESVADPATTKETKTAADQMSAIEGVTDVELKETTPEPEKTSVTAEQAEIVALDKSKLVPPKRKSKSVDTETQQAKEEHQRKESLTSTEQNKSVAEDKTPVPTRRKSRTSDISITSEPAGSHDGSSEKAKLSPTKRKSKGGKPSPVLESKKVTEAMKEPVGQNISDSQQPKLVPARRKSKSLDMSTVSEPDSKSKEATIENRKASLTSQIITGTSESAALEPGKISPPKRKPKSSKATPELPKKEPTVTKKEPNSELSSIPAVGKESIKTVKNGKLPPTRRKSQTLPPEADPKKGTETMKEPEGQEPSDSTEQTEEAVLEVAKLTPPRRKSKGLDVSTAPEPVSVTVEGMDASTGATEGLPEKKVATVILDTPSDADGGGQTLTEQFVMEISESVVLEEGKVAQARRKSKSSKVSPERPISQPTDTKEPFESDKPPSLPDVVTRSTEITVEENGQLSPIKRKSKDHSFSPEVAADEVTETTKEPQNLESLDSRQQTEEYSEVTKIIPTRRKSRGPPPEECPEKKVVTVILDTPDQSESGETLSAQISMHISEGGVGEEKMPPIKRESDSPEPDMREQTNDKEPPEECPEKKVATVILDTQDQSESGETLSAQISMHISEGGVGEEKMPPIKRESDSPEPDMREQTNDKEPHESEKRSTSNLVPESTEVTTVENGQLIPPKRRSKDLSLSPEPLTTEVTMQEPEKQESPDFKQQTEESLGATKVIPNRRKSKGLDGLSFSEPVSAPAGDIDVQSDETRQDSETTTDAPDGELKKKVATVELNTPEDLVHSVDTLTPVITEVVHIQTSGQGEDDVHKMDASTPHAEPVETEEPKDKPKEALEQTQPTGQTTTTLDDPDYMDKLWSNTTEVQKRYLVLDLPESGVFQEGTKHELPTGSSEPASAVLTSVQQQEVKAETSSSEQEVKPSPSVTSLEIMKTTEEQPKEDKEHGFREELTAEKTLNEMMVAEVQESTAESQENVTKSDSTQPTSTAVQPSEAETLTEIILCEHDAGDTTQPAIQLELVETAKEEHKEAKDHGPVRLETITLGMGRIPEDADLHDSETHVKDGEFSVLLAKESRIDIQTNVQSESNTEDQGNIPRRGSAELNSATLQLDETEFVEINLYEKTKPRQVETQAGVSEAQQEPEATENWVQVSTHDTPASTGETPLLKKIEVGPEVHVLQLDIASSLEEHEDKQAKDPMINIDVKITHGRETENRDVAPETKTVEVQESSSEKQQNVAQSDSAEAQPLQRPSEETTSQSKSQAELLEPTGEMPAEVKDHGIQEEQVDTQDMNDVFKVQEVEILQNKADRSSSPKSTIRDDETDGSISLLATGPNQDADTDQSKIAANVHPQTPTEKQAMSITTQGNGAQSRRDFAEVLSKQEEAKPSQHEAELEPTPKRPKEEEGNKVLVKQATEVPTKTTNEKLHGVDLPQDQSLHPAVGDEATLVGGSPFKEHRDEDEKSVGAVIIQAADRSPMKGIFSEIQTLAQTGPSVHPNEVTLLEDSPGSLTTCTSDQDDRLSRLLSKLLTCKNRSPELSPGAVAAQLKDAEECHEAAQAQVLLLSQLRAAEAESKDALEFVEDQWNAAAQDAAAVIQRKEVQMQLVTDFCRQAEVVETTLERLTDELRQCPSESSSKEAESLSSLQRSIEENRTELGELLLAHNKLCLHFSQHQRATANTELKNLQEKWGGLERAVEKKFHHTKVQAQETRNLLTDISSLLGHLESVGKDFEAPAGSQWNYKEAQQLMVANAQVRAAQKKYLLLQELSEALLHSSGSNDTQEIQQGLQKVKDQLAHTEKLQSRQVQGSMNPIMEKIIMVMRDGLAWAKQTEADIEGKRKRVALLPEEVHQQLRDLRKLQFEVTVKQSQLESLVEEVTELLPQLDQEEEVPVVRSSLETLEELSKSTSEKLANCVRETESGLQTREKLSGQIADLDSWVEAHLHREAARNAEAELRSSTEIDRRDRQIQETLAEAEKQSAACEALLMKSKDIASELSITENCQLFSKLTKLQDDIKAIIGNERLNKKELEELIQTGESSKRKLVTIEKSLRQMLVDLNKHRFPITRESLQALEPFKHLILEHKAQVDLLQQWIPQEKTKEMYSAISEIYSKLVNLQMKSKDHESYLNMRQSVEDLRESVQEQVRLPKEDCRDVVDKYKICQSLLVQFPLIKSLCQEAASKLQTISADLYPSQLTVERQRLEQNKDSLKTLEMTASNNLSIIEWDLLKELDLDFEKKATQAFLKETHQELQRLSQLEPKDATIGEEHHRVIALRRTVESRVRAWEILEQRKGTRESTSRDLMDLKNLVLRECDSQMENIAQARKSLRSYNGAITQAVWFLRDTEASLLPPQGSVGVCSQRLPETQQLLASLEHNFQTHMDQIRDTVPLHPHLCPQQVEQLQEKILSQLLVRMSTVKAKGEVQLERLNRCAEQHRKYTERREEITQRLRSAESSLSQLISQKITCLSDCTDQQMVLTALCEEVETLQRRLEEMSEWCPEQSCRMSRKSAGTAAWRRVSRLRRCARELTSRSNLRIAEWSNITSSVDKASAVLQQVEAESPGILSVTASTEELHDLQQSWEQYQDRLDFEHRALSALELRIARLLGVPAHLEQAPPTPLCQQLQAMQGRYSSVKAQSREGLQATQKELADRDKVREELQVVQVWTLTADSLLSEMEQSCSTLELQEIHRQLCTQKALLQRVMENLKVKYLDLYSLVPVEIDAQLQETKAVLQQVEVKVGEAVEKSGPVHRLGAKLSEIQSGLESVRKRLEQRSPSVGEAKGTQKRVWDELDVWHSCLAALEVDMQDLEHPAEVLLLTERLVEVQQLHSHLAKQAEQRTTLISKIHLWLQEHQEMINSSQSWMSEAQSWLAAPCTYKTAKCLSSHVHALQIVLNDSAQIRTTLQDFGTVLEEMSQVCEVTELQQQLLDTDQEVAAVQESFTAPLAQLEHAAAEVEAIEDEVKKMEADITEIKTFLSSPETFPSPREQILKQVESRIQSMRRTVAEIQKCKPGLCLPEKAEETLGVFVVVDQLQMLLLELEKKVPALFIQQPPTPIQVKAQPSLEAGQEEKEGAEPAGGLIRIAHVEQDVLQRSGAALLTVETASPEQRKSWTPDGGVQPEQTGLREEQPEQEGGGGVLWWLWDAFLGSSPEEPLSEVELGTEVTESQATGSRQDVEGLSDSTDSSSSAALSKPLATVRTQALPGSMVNTASLNLSKADSRAQQRCVVS